MGRAVGFVCAVVLAVISIASGDADEENKSISSTELGGNSFSSVTQPSVNVETSTHPTSESNEDCFCTYEYHDPLVKARLGERTLVIGDTIRLNERVSFECIFPCTILTWQNGTRLHGKVHMICNTCEKWQILEVPICKSFEKSDIIISFSEDLNILPGGIAIVQKGKKHQFFCSSTGKHLDWDYGERKGVSATSNYVSGSGTLFYGTYLEFDKETDNINGTYTCFQKDYLGRRQFISTLLHLQVNDEEDKSISSTQSGENSFSGVTQPSINVETSTHPTSESNEDCFCTYEFHDPLVKAQLGERTLEIGDTIRLNERVSFECIFPCTILTWQNDTRLHGKVHMICNTCKKWQIQDVPVCKSFEKSDIIISFSEDLNVLPGGIAIVQKGKKHQFFCSSTGKQLDWDYGERKGVSVTSNYVSGNGTLFYGTYLEFDKEADNINGTYTCFQKDYLGRRQFISTLLHLQVNESTCSIHDLSMSVPETVEPDMSMVSGEDVTFGSEVKLKCTKNFVMIGNSKAQCEEKGKWKLGRFQCVPGCPLNLNPSSHLSVEPKKDGYRTGDSITLSCPPGEETSNSVDIMMCMFGRWSDTLPECVQKGKEKLPSTSGITNTNFTHGVQGCPLNLDPASHLIVEPKKDVYRTGDSITLACPPDEETSTNVQIMMCMFGGWSETLPECVQKVEEMPRSASRI